MDNKLLKQINEGKFDNALERALGQYNNGGYCGGVVKSKNIAMHSGNVEAYDVATINSAYVLFSSICFDGRYIYYCPLEFAVSSQPSYFLRYDTTGSFTSSGSWSSIELTNGGSTPTYFGYRGISFDGRYIYLVQDHSTLNGPMLRYDTQATFTHANLEAYTIPGNAGWSTACFDGQYVYYLPTKNISGTYHGTIVRYDTTGSFTSAGSWTSFDLTTINAAYTGFWSCALDGKYIYMIGNVNGSGRHGNMIKYDTSLSFTSAGSYEVIDISGINSNWKGFNGAAACNGSLYLCPWSNDAGRHGNLVKCDFSKDFESNGAWSSINVASLDAGYVGFSGLSGIGSNIYLIPNSNTTVPFGDVLELDTTKSFETSNVQEFDLAGISVNYKGYYGSCFDGQWMYLCPYQNATSTPHGNMIRIRLTPYNRSI